MKKLFTLFAIMMAFSFTAKAQTITVPAELNGWYAGYYCIGSTREVACNNVLTYYIEDGLDAAKWTASAQANLENALYWGSPTATGNYYGQISNNTFTVGEDYAQNNFVAFFIVNNANLVSGANWRIYVPQAKGDYTLTADDLLLQGTFGTGVTPTALENTTATVKAQKTIENGQVVIIRDGKKFNAVGAKL